MDSNRQKRHKISNYLLKKRKRSLKQIQSSSFDNTSNNYDEIFYNYSKVAWNFNQFFGFNWNVPYFSKDIKHLSIYLFIFIYR